MTDRLKQLFDQLQLKLEIAYAEYRHDQIEQGAFFRWLDAGQTGHQDEHWLVAEAAFDRRRAFLKRISEESWPNVLPLSPSRHVHAQEPHNYVSL